MNQEVQTPAGDPSKMSPAQQLKAGMGGSYTFDPATGQTTLNDRTDTAAGGVSLKHPDAPRNLPEPQADGADEQDDAAA